MIPVPSREYGFELLTWTHSRVKDGIAALKRERGYRDFEKVVKFIEKGDLPFASRALSQTTDNRLRKVAFEIIGALTDVRPIWNYETYDAKYDNQSAILNKLARGWWRSSFADRRLQNILMHSLAGGSGYGYLTWNPHLPGGGDFELIPFDPRDVIPIGPVFSDSVQDWQGVILRQRKNIESVRMMYPLKAATLGRGASSWVDGMGKLDEGRGGILSTVWDVLAGTGQRNPPKLIDQVDLYTIFLKDDALNTSDQPILMGDPDSPESYTVPSVVSGKSWEECKLYPRGRYIVCTTDTVCEDGPNPYWHGQFPIIRFTLEPLPWSLLGIPILQEMMPLQHALNEGIRGLEDGMAQWIRRGVVGDRNAISKANFDAIDPRKDGMKAYVNQNIGGEGFKLLDGPTYPPWYIQMLQYYKDEIDELSGVRGLQQMRGLKQMPSSDTLEKYMDAMSPLLRVRARMMEVALGELAELLKVGFFQFYTKKRRMEILGVDGLTLEDYDYDPDTMVPAALPGEDTTRTERAQRHHKNFKFSVAPNTFLNISHTEQRMVLLQLYRANVLDPWSLWKAMDIPDAGEPPAETVPERMIAAKNMGILQGPTPDMIQTQNAMQLAQLQMQLLGLQQQLQAMGVMPPTVPGFPPPIGPPGPGGMMPPGGGGTPPPPGGAPPQPNVPGNNGVGPQGGRPPMGGQPPQIVNKDGGGRATVSESGR